MTNLLDKIAPAAGQKLLSASRRASQDAVNFPEVFRQKFDWLDAKRLNRQHGTERSELSTKRSELASAQKESTASVRSRHDQRQKAKEYSDQTSRLDQDRRVENESTEPETERPVATQDDAASRSHTGDRNSEETKENSKDLQKPDTSEVRVTEEDESLEKAVNFAAQEQLQQLTKIAVQSPTSGTVDQDATVINAEEQPQLPVNPSEALLKSLRAISQPSTAAASPAGAESEAAQNLAKLPETVVTQQIAEASQQVPSASGSKLLQSAEATQTDAVTQSADLEAEAAAIAKSVLQDKSRNDGTEPVKVTEQSQRLASHPTTTLLNQAVQQPADVSEESSTQSESRHLLPQDVTVVQMQTGHHAASSGEPPSPVIMKTDSIMQPGAPATAATQMSVTDRGDTTGRENVNRVVKAAQAALGRGSSQIQIRLDPPELGHLRIAVRQSSSGLQLQLQASNPRALHLIEHSSGELRAALESQGLHATRIDVQLRSDLRQDQSAPQQQDHGGRSGGQGGSLSQQGQAFGDPTAGQNNFYREQSQDMSFFNRLDESRPESHPEQAVERSVNSANKVDLTV